MGSFGKFSAHTHKAQLMLSLPQSSMLLLGPLSQRRLISHAKLNVLKVAPDGSFGAHTIP